MILQWRAFHVLMCDSAFVFVRLWQRVIFWTRRFSLLLAAELVSVLQRFLSLIVKYSATRLLIYWSRLAKLTWLWCKKCNKTASHLCGTQSPCNVVPWIESPHNSSPRFNLLFVFLCTFLGGKIHSFRILGGPSNNIIDVKCGKNLIKMIWART